MPHNTCEYNFAYNEGGLLKFVWKNMFVSEDSPRNNRNSKNDSNGWNQGQQQQQRGQQGNGIGSNAGNNNDAMDHNQLQRGKG